MIRALDGRARRDRRAQIKRWRWSEVEAAWKRQGDPESLAAHYAQTGEPEFHDEAAA